MFFTASSGTGLSLTRFCRVGLGFTEFYRVFFGNTRFTTVARSTSRGGPSCWTTCACWRCLTGGRRCTNSSSRAATSTNRRRPRPATPTDGTTRSRYAIFIISFILILMALCQCLLGFTEFHYCSISPRFSIILSSSIVWMGSTR